MESATREVEVEIHSPPKRRKIHDQKLDKQLIVVLSPLSNKQEQYKNYKRIIKTPLKRNLETNLVGISSLKDNSSCVTNNNIENMDLICSVDDTTNATDVSNNTTTKDSGLGTLMENTHLQSVRTSVDLQKRYVYSVCLS